MKSKDNKKLAAEWFEKAEEDRKSIEAILNRYYITTRYPSDVPEGFSIDLAIQAFKSAKRIKNWVLNKF